MNFEDRLLKTFWLGFVHLLSHHVMLRWFIGRQNQFWTCSWARSSTAFLQSLL